MWQTLAFMKSHTKLIENFDRSFQKNVKQRRKGNEMDLCVKKNSNLDSAVEQQSDTYLCPYCGEENSLSTSTGNVNTLVEQLVTCEHCHETINITTAYAPNGQRNIIAFEHETTKFKKLSA